MNQFPANVKLFKFPVVTRKPVTEEVERKAKVMEEEHLKRARGITEDDINCMCY